MNVRTAAPSHETQADFGRRLGVSRQRVGAMIKAGLAIDASGMIDVAAGLTWVQSNIEPRRGGSNRPGKTPKDAVDLVEARRLKIIADTELTRLIIANKASGLVDKEEVRRALAAFSRLIRDKWINFGNRYGQQIAAAAGADPKVVMAELDKAVRIQLDEIANTKATLPE